MQKVENELYREIFRLSDYPRVHMSYDFWDF